MKSLVITIMRKPLDDTLAQNALEHGCGGLNIDGCRIGAFVNTTPSGMDRYNEALNEQGYRPGSYQKGTASAQPSGKLGRWPANLILTHKPGCECVGVKRVKGSHDTTGVWGCGPQNVYGTYGAVAPQQGYTDPDGKETVENWICVDNCPVRDLDEQSGMLTSGTGAVKRQSSSGQKGNQGSAFGAESRAEGTPMISYGDKGGASRFYKQFKMEK